MKDCSFSNKLGKISPRKSFLSWGNFFRFVSLVGVFSLSIGIISCGGSGGEEPGIAAPDASLANVDFNEEFSGGETTVFIDSADFSFSSPATNLEQSQKTRFFVGNSFFETNWVIAPASTTGVDGLGPVFNSKSCSGCHFKDGRGKPPTNADEIFLGLLLRLSVPGTTAQGGPVPVPHYGLQLNHRGIAGVAGEATPVVTYEENIGSYADGRPYTLLNPTYEIVNPQFGDLPEDLLISPRVAPQMIGMGLLENIPESAILFNADPNDINGDGISGKPNYVWSSEDGRTELGRFGWKANVATVAEQVAGAFLGDVGITSRIFPDENCEVGQVDCIAAPSGGSPDISDGSLDDTIFYTQTLAVPARRNWTDETVLRGKKLFTDMKCAQCHTPQFQTGVNSTIPQLSNQSIRPYTDLLLHDMGEGLADGRPDFFATGREWRTPPLWGIGLVETVNKHTRFMHDGRARSLEEAILWHGGEAKSSQESFRNASRAEREALVKFLKSL